MAFFPTQDLSEQNYQRNKWIKFTPLLSTVCCGLRLVIKNMTMETQKIVLGVINRTCRPNLWVFCLSFFIISHEGETMVFRNQTFRIKFELFDY